YRPAWSDPVIGTTSVFDELGSNTSGPVATVSPAIPMMSTNDTASCAASVKVSRTSRGTVSSTAPAAGAVRTRCRCARASAGVRRSRLVARVGISQRRRDATTVREGNGADLQDSDECDWPDGSLRSGQAGSAVGVERARFELATFRLQT